MPRQFKAAPRESVLEQCESESMVDDARAVGNGILVVYKGSMGDHTRIYTYIVERFGWYPASYEPRSDGDRAVLMPITEVPKSND